MTHFCGLEASQEDCCSLLSGSASGISVKGTEITGEEMCWALSIGSTSGTSFKGTEITEEEMCWALLSGLASGKEIGITGEGTCWAIALRESGCVGCKFSCKAVCRASAKCVIVGKR